MSCATTGAGVMRRRCASNVPWAGHGGWQGTGRMSASISQSKQSGAAGPARGEREEGELLGAWWGSRAYTDACYYCI